MAKTETTSVARRTRTIAIPVDLHDRLRMAALAQSLQKKRRITLQDLAEEALHSYLARPTTMPDVQKGGE
jgi:hypothetical protein